MLFFFCLIQVPDLYSTDGSYTTDPWVPHAAHYGSYAHAAHAHAAQAHAYHHNMAQYGSLLRLPQHYGHSSRLVCKKIEYLKIYLSSMTFLQEKKLENRRIFKMNIYLNWCLCFHSN